MPQEISPSSEGNQLPSDILEQPGSSPVNPGTTLISSQHVMISYSWAQQDLAFKLQRYLEKSGFRVWIDVEQMQGFLCERMAEAVEEAFVVVMLVSEDYRVSHACKSEANYSYQLKKPLVPVIAQSNYMPMGGWLSFMIAGILYYKMYNDINFDQNFPKVCQYIASLQKGPNNNEQIKSSVSPETQNCAHAQKLPIAAENGTADIKNTSSNILVNGSTDYSYSNTTQKNGESRGVDEIDISDQVALIKHETVETGIVVNEDRTRTASEVEKDGAARTASTGATDSEIELLITSSVDEENRSSCCNCCSIM